MILCIDPGNEQSAVVELSENAEIIPQKFISPNNEIVSFLMQYSKTGNTLVVEMIASYGMPVGKTVFETCVWIGRFIQAWGGVYQTIYRSEVKTFLCNSIKAKDSNVRQALIDRFGEVGTKKNPGKLYGFKADMWAALAVGVTYVGQKNMGYIGRQRSVLNAVSAGK